ncbi:MAG: winged helix-turn-helix domain-containing protein [Bacteroidetes bacterium]|nr:winged helix-turn-helix domain-containing protein [Bacteroidota bacterium]
MDNKEIDLNAGLICLILDTLGDMQINELEKLTELNAIEFNLALGWLVRADNILFYDYNFQKWIHLL